MSGEEPPPEDRKLSAVRSWFTRSVSFGGVHGSSTALAAVAASKGLSEGNGHNREDQEAWQGFNTNLRQLSMRRSKPSSENERETGLGSPAMTPRNVTPLTPLTPLRWKSNLREQEEEKALERSRLGLSVSNATLLSGEHSREDSENEQEAEHMIPTDVNVQTNPVNGFVPKVQTAAAAAEEDDESMAIIESPSGQDMKTSPGEDVMSMTIDFLRARLLSERSASKAARQRIQELEKKVMELELKLKQEVVGKRKAEKTADEALLKLKTAGSGSGGEEVKEELQHPESSSVGDFSRTDSIGSSLGSKDSEDSRRKPQVRVEGHGNADVWVTPKNMFLIKGESPQKQDARAAIESRLRHMWSQISAEMTALAVDGSQEELVQEQLLSWMDQVPAVLHDRSPQKSVIPVEQMQFNSAIEVNGGQRQKKTTHQQDSKFALSPPEGVEDKVQVEEDVKRAEVMLEEYEAHKRVQREWERNYYESKQRLEQSKGSFRGDAMGTSNLQRDYSRMDDKGGPRDLPDDFGMPRHGVVHRSKSSIDFGHPHMPRTDGRDDSYSDSESWGGVRLRRTATMDGQYNTNDIPDHRQRLALMNHPHRQAERPAALARAHESESREWHEKQLQQDYQDTYFQQPSSQGVRRQTRSYLEGDSQNRPYARSGEDAYRNSRQDNGGAHLMWDYRDHTNGGLGQTPADSYYRQSEREREDPNRSNLQSEKKHRHGHRRSRSHNSNWPTEEDYRLMDVPHQQRLGGEVHPSHPVYPGKATHNSFGVNYGDDLPLRHETPSYGMMTGHRQDQYLDEKTNRSGQHMPPQGIQTGPAKAPEPKLFLGYGPAFDAPRDHAPSQPLQQDRVGNKSVADVLLALQKAKASIQKSGSDRVPYRGFTDQPRASMEPEYGLDPRTQYMSARLPEHDVGAPRIRSSNSSPSLNYNPSAMDLRPAANGHISFVDQLNVGKGIEFFFP